MLMSISSLRFPFRQSLNRLQGRPKNKIQLKYNNCILITVKSPLNLWTLSTRRKLNYLIFFLAHSESCHTLALYKHMAAFVMAYSFTEHKSSHNDDDEQEDSDAGPAMVPMADILNHISNNNAHLEFGAETLTMVAIQDIQNVRINYRPLS